MKLLGIQLKEAILRGLSREVMPGEVDTVDNLLEELYPIIFSLTKIDRLGKLETKVDQILSILKRDE